MKIQKLVLFLLCFLNCISSQCVEKEKDGKKNLCLIYEPYPGTNLDPLIYNITVKFYEIYQLKCGKSIKDFEKRLSEFLKKDPVFLQDNPNVCYNISLSLLMKKIVTFYGSEEETIKYFLNKWNELLK